MKKIQIVFTLFIFLGLQSLWAQTPLRGNLWDILRGMPPEIRKELKGGPADERGMVGQNRRSGYLGAEYQRGGMDTLLAGVVLRDKDKIDEGFRVANATFMKQKADGSFGDRFPTGAAFWMAACARSFLLLQESEYWPDYQAQMEGYYESLQLSADFLVKNLKALEKHDQNTPNRLLIDADALFLTAKLLGNDPPPEAAELRDEGLALFDKNSGEFLENGGGDSSYQAVNLQMLMFYVTFYPSPDIDAMIQKGLAWELTKVNPDGSIDTKGNSRTGVGKETYSGHPKEVNTREVALMFAYAGQLYQNDQYTQTALLIHDHEKE